MSRVRVFGSEHLFAGRKNAMVEGLGLRIATLVMVDHRQSIEGLNRIRVFGTEQRLAHGDYTTVYRLGFGVLTSFDKVENTVIEKSRSACGIDVELFDKGSCHS